MIDNQYKNTPAFACDLSSKQTVTGSNPVALTITESFPTKGFRLFLIEFNTGSFIFIVNVNVNIKTTIMRKKLKELQNGCSRTEVFISPKNYKSIRSKSQMPKNWFVECRFHDPALVDKFPNGYPYRKKFSGESLSELKAIAEIYKEEMEHQLDVQNYHPIKKVYMTDRSGELHPGLFFVDALEKTFQKLEPHYKTKHHAKQVRCMIARIKKVQYITRLDLTKISEIRTYHIKNLLDALELTDSVYNKFRTYLMSLFKELVQYGCVDSNYIRDISKRETSVKPRQILTQEKFDYVFNYIKENHYNFFRYAVIFHYSGARSSELMRLKKSDVDLDNLEFVVKILKGRKESIVSKAIIPASYKYWEEIISECKNDDDFIFSRTLKPGKTEISGRAITLQWKRKVKETKDIIDSSGNIINVTEDFYSLKHLFLRKLNSIPQETLAPIINLAQGAASHQSPRTTRIYTGNDNSKELTILKNLDVI